TSRGFGSGFSGGFVTFETVVSCGRISGTRRSAPQTKITAAKTIAPRLARFFQFTGGSVPGTGFGRGTGTGAIAGVSVRRTGGTGGETGEEEGALADLTPGSRVNSTGGLAARGPGGGTGGTAGCAGCKSVWAVKAFASGTSVGGRVPSGAATSGTGGPCRQAYSLLKLT